MVSNNIAKADEDNGYDIHTIYVICQASGR